MKAFAGKRIAFLNDKSTYGEGLATEAQKAYMAKGVKAFSEFALVVDDKDAVLAIRKHGVLRGLPLAGWRLLRCNPWSHGGVDYP